MVWVPCPPVIIHELFDELTLNKYVLPPTVVAVNVFPVVAQTGGVVGAVIVHDTPPLPDTLKVLVHELVHPLLFVIVTVYVPAVLRITHCVVAPVLHR